MTTPDLYKLPTSTRARRRALVVGMLLGLAVAGGAGLSAAVTRVAALSGYPSELGLPSRQRCRSPAASRCSFPWASSLAACC